jgi:hypothetical protein
VISPDEIRRKAANLYRPFLRAWLAGDVFFPRVIPTNRTLDRDDIPAAIAAMHSLRAGAKETLGYGYSIEWRTIRSGHFGRNPFPDRIVLETPEDLLRLIGKSSEFKAFAAAIAKIRNDLPQLNDWTAKHLRTVIDIAPDLDRLIGVAKYFLSHPNPGCYVRELPVPVDTKFIERYEAVLMDWLNRLLPPQAIHSGETKFARRFGLRTPSSHFLMRFLCPVLQAEAGCPWSELSLPLESLATLSIRPAQVLIVENRINLLTLPPCSHSLALWGEGHAVVEFRTLPWLSDADVIYWGDIDVEGFAILSSLRATFPHVRSLHMDEETIDCFPQFHGNGTGRTPPVPPLLTPAERAAFERCCRENLRLEQERVPFPTAWLDSA